MMKFITVVLGLVSLGHMVSAEIPVVVGGTGTFRSTAPGQCDISMKAYGWLDTGVGMIKNSYIKVNDLIYYDSLSKIIDYRGFNLVTLDMNTCKASNYGHFDIFASPAEADKLANYITGIKDGTHILGATDDDGFKFLNDAARAALKSIGADTTGLVYADKMIFHAIKGRPEKAVVKTNKAAGDNLFYEEKAAPCIVCQNGGTLSLNSAGTGFECQCLSYTGPYCEKVSVGRCVEHITTTASGPARKR